MKIELCAASPEAIDFAAKGAVDRIELCQNLEQGGLTPSIALLDYALSKKVAVHVLIRPRIGNFHYSEAEKGLMRKEVESMVSKGVQGIVIGALQADRSLDIQWLQDFKKDFGEIEFTFHRAIDEVKAPDVAFAQLVDIGFSRVLTSGGWANVELGWRRLQSWSDQWGQKLEFMAGGGVRVDLVQKLMQIKQLSAIHFSATDRVSSSSDLFYAEVLQFNPRKAKNTIAAIVASNDPKHTQ